MFQVAATLGYARKYRYDWGVPNDQRESTILTHFPKLPRVGGMQRSHREQINGSQVDWFNFHQIPDLGPRITLIGFFQSLKYFEHCQDEVKKIFKLDFVPGYEDAVSIHVRRGDYVTYPDNFPPVDMNYLNQAMEHFPGRRFVVFSDGMDWCRQNLKGDQFEFREGNEFEDLSLMSSCGDHIIANSTFSWWGAWLGHNQNKRVIAPSIYTPNWFGHKSSVKVPPLDLLPEDWVQIKWRG